MEFLKKPILLVLFFFQLSSLSAQNAGKFSISGELEDSFTGEKLIGATIYDYKTGLGITSNIYGFYSLTLPSDSVDLLFSYVGYKPLRKSFLLNHDLRIDIKLDPGELLAEAEVVAEIEQIEERTQMSSMELDMNKVRTLPVLLGERDIIKTLQLLPGVQKGSEGASGLYVRGGSPDQNLILLDGVPVYNASHLFGFFSVFNSDAIKNVDLIKGGFPARYGGRVSSVLDIRMKEGNMNEIKGEGSVGIVASRMTLEGPITKNKTSFLISGRRTYIDLLAQPFILAASDEGTGGYYFYDLNTKINHIIDENNRIYLSGYFGRDRAYARYNTTYSTSSEKFKSSLSWGNAIVALRWNHHHNNKLFSNTTATFSNYNFSTDVEFEYREDDEESESTKFIYDSGIRDYGVKIDFDYIPQPNHYIKFGGGYTYHTFTPGINTYEISDPYTDLDTTFGSNRVFANNLHLYVEDDWKVNSRLKINAGLHVAAFLVKDKTYVNPQPRFSSRFMLNDVSSLKASYARMTQYLHLLSNTSIGLPTDLWLPATDQTKPQISDQIALGYARSLGPMFEVSTEVYYKWMQNLIEYKDGASFQGTGEDWQTKIETGSGDAYGLEFLLEKKKGKLSGWIGYTLSWSTRQFDNLNNGEVFPYRFDRRHDIGLALTYVFNEHVDAGFVWVYGTGNAVTLPVGQTLGYTQIPGLNSYNSGFNNSLDIITERNAFRTPSYHRADIGVNLHKEKKWGTRTWSLGFYNVYNRQNPFFLYFSDDSNGDKKLFQISLFPILPAVSYNFKF